MRKNTIYKDLLKYSAHGMSSFHTPGHKNAFFEDLYRLDYTELSATDDLYKPKKSILETEKKASKIFNSGCSLISASGCTLCIKAMIALFCKYRSKVICSRMIHRSAIHAMAILDLKPLFLIPRLDANKNFYEQITSHEIEKLLDKNKNDVGAVYITSPDYYGSIADVANISRVCKKYNVPLLVDNAHGSHLAFLSSNYHPLSLGADATADSLHKTLPVLTGGALLHLKDKSLYNRAKYWMEFFGSSSPSFPIMASIDICLDWIKNKGKTEFLKLEEKTRDIKKTAKTCGIDVLYSRADHLTEISKPIFCGSLKNKENDSTDYVNCSSSENIKDDHELLREAYKNATLCDPIRICFNVNSVGLTGSECAKLFRKNKVEPEFYDKSFIVFIPTPLNTDEDFFRLADAIRCLPKRGLVHKKETEISFCNRKIGCSLYEAVFKFASEKIATHLTVGRIATRAENICPPGIPIIIPGEIITKNAVNAMVSKGIDEVYVAKQK